MIAPLANALWFASSLPEHRRFRQACRDVAQTQHKVLWRLLQANAATEFGRQHEFSSIRSIPEFQSRVPLRCFDEYETWAGRIAAGTSNVLTSQPVLLLEPTSGSTSATKLIPVTASLKNEFGRAVAAWIVDLMRHDWRLLSGQAYWSVSPVSQRDRRSAGGLPIGFEDDAEYFGWLQRHLVQAIQAVPPQVRFISDAASFRYVTLLFLLRSADLSLISVWNPTFLRLLLDDLPAQWPSLVEDIARGTLSPPSALSADLHTQLSRFNRPNARRAVAVRAVFEAALDEAELYACLWPRLRLISVWADSHAARDAASLSSLFPLAHFQPKGVIATEGIVSIPVSGQEGAALAIRSHFFEFLPMEDQVAAKVPQLAHQLESGRTYEVVMTTGGGLYRYRLGDVVEVVGHLQECPLLRFVGRAAFVCDRFGEKLHEAHVRRELETLLRVRAIDVSFAMLSCEEVDGTWAYTLFMESDAHDGVLRDLGAALERALQANFHYRYCRHLGQLGALRVFRMESHAAAKYFAACQKHGQRAGDIKMTVLHPRSGWMQEFEGRLLSKEDAFKVL